MQKPHTPASQSAHFRPKYVARRSKPQSNRLHPAPTAQDRSLKVEFEIPERFLPALASAVEEEKNEVGGRLEGSFSFATEHALTDGAVGLGILYAAVIKAIRTHNVTAPKFRQLATAHPDWRTR